MEEYFTFREYGNKKFRQLENDDEIIEGEIPDESPDDDLDDEDEYDDEEDDDEVV